MNAVTIQIDPTLEKEARTVLQEMGLSLSAAVNLFLRQTVQKQAIPFPLSDDISYTELERKHLEGIRQYQEGRYVVKTMEELEAMARDGT